MKSKSNPQIIDNLNPRIVLKFHDQVNIPYSDDHIINDFFLEKKMVSWRNLLQKYPGIRVTKLFTTLSPGSLTEMVDKAKIESKRYKPPNFLTYFAVDCPKGAEIDELLKEIWKDTRIEYAYEESGPVEPPVVMARNNLLYTNQGYLDVAPFGIDAKYAWNFGGDGTGNIQFIDIEQGWDLTHEDLPNNPPIPILSGLSMNFIGHGTSVLGVVLAQDNNIGCVGITPFVKASVVSQYRPALAQNTLVHNTADAITAAIHVMNSGDVLLIEAQVRLKRFNHLNYYPPESEMAIFDAIKLGTSKGIIIVEPAANGGMDLDDFNSSTKKKVLRRPLNENDQTDFKESGAIMVAGASSTVPHKKDTGTNFGSRIDCYAWAENIQTTGDGDKGTSTKKYTTKFNGTSGASAIIAGAAISVQSMLETAGKQKFIPEEMRKILSDPDNGTMSENVTDKIGVMPDLKFIKDNVL